MRLNVVVGVAAGAVFALVACSTQEQLAKFESDGCSLFPDQDLITRADWCECCALHDAAYWRGGTEEHRAQADTALRDCVLEKTQDANLATLMYEGVRIGGSPYFYNWYRWGYGWPFQRKYQALTAVEWRQVERRWREFEADARESDSGHLVCTQTEPSMEELRSVVF